MDGTGLMGAMRSDEFELPFAARARAATDGLPRHQKTLLATVGAGLFMLMAGVALFSGGGGGEVRPGERPQQVLGDAAVARGTPAQPQQQFLPGVPAVVATTTAAGAAAAASAAPAAGAANEVKALEAEVALLKAKLELAVAHQRASAAEATFSAAAAGRGQR